METTKRREKLTLLTPHSDSDPILKHLNLTTNYSVKKLTSKVKARSVCAIVVKASWAKENQKKLHDLYVIYPDALLLVIEDKTGVEVKTNFLTIAYPTGSSKVAKDCLKKYIHQQLHQWNQRLQLVKIKKEIELDGFSKPFLSMLIDRFNSKNAFLMIAEEEPDARGFASLGHDLYFRAVKPCDFESTLQSLDNSKSSKSNYFVYQLEVEGLRGFKVWFGLEFQEYRKVKGEDFATILAPIQEHIVNVIALHEAQSNNMIDDLTSLYNQRYLITVLDREISRSRRQKNAFSVLFLDVDYFKQVNDTKGHWVGSRVLAEMGGVLKNLVRNSDYCFRYGGDEFVVVLVGTDQNHAGLTAERIRKQIEATEFQVEGIKLNITVSIGVAVYPNHAQTAKEIVKLADQAMYVSKRTRNSTHMSGA